MMKIDMYFSKYYIITQLRDLIPKSSIKKYNEKSGGMVTVLLIEIDDLTLYWKNFSVIEIDVDYKYEREMILFNFRIYF